MLFKRRGDWRRDRTEDKFFALHIAQLNLQYHITSPEPYQEYPVSISRCGPETKTKILQKQKRWVLDRME